MTDKIKKAVTSNPAASTKKTVAMLEKENAELLKKLQKQEDNTGIALDAYIEVMSLVPFKLNLSTEKRGRGRQFSFTRYGEVKRILYNDLASIFENYRTFMEQGYFYILNQKVVRKHGMDDMYEHILPKEKIDEILNFNDRTAVKFYKIAGDVQRDIIDGMLVKIVKEQLQDEKTTSKVDFNVISQISKIGGRDILTLANDLKQLEEESVK